MKYEETAKRIREALSDKEMTQQELANKSGINKSSISQWCNGRNRPDSFSAYDLSLVLDVAPEWLMGFPVPKYNLNIEYQKMSNTQQQRLMKYVELLKKEIVNNNET